MRETLESKPCSPTYNFILACPHANTESEHLSVFYLSPNNCSTSEAPNKGASFQRPSLSRIPGPNTVPQPIAWSRICRVDEWREKNVDDVPAFTVFPRNNSNSLQERSSSRFGNRTEGEDLLAWLSTLQQQPSFWAISKVLPGVGLFLTHRSSPMTTSQKYSDASVWFSFRRPMQGFWLGFYSNDILKREHMFQGVISDGLI